MTDLLVLGPGRLGMKIAQKWKDLYPEAKIFLKFRSDNAERCREMLEKGFIVLTEGSDTCKNYFIFDKF